MGVNWPLAFLLSFNQVFYYFLINYGVPYIAANERTRAAASRQHEDRPDSRYSHPESMSGKRG